MTIYTAPVKE